MSQQPNLNFLQNHWSQRKSQSNQHNLKEIIAIVHEKKKHYKKALSQIDSTILHQSNLKYVFNSSNPTNAVTPQQKEFIKEEDFARGSIAQLQPQDHQKGKKYRTKNSNQKNHRSMKKKQYNSQIQSHRLKRYNTQSNEQDTYELKRSILCSVPKQLPTIDKYEKSKNRLRINIAQIKRTGKGSQKFQRIYLILTQFNPFFAKLDKAVGICLLRIGQFKNINPHKVLYEMGDTQKRIFIILDGEIKLKGPESMRKFCSTGETLLQEVLFKQDFAGSLQKAVVSLKSLVLQIDMIGFDKLMKELFRQGYKHEARELTSLIRRNFILKNWIRNKFRLAHNN